MNDDLRNNFHSQVFLLATVLLTMLAWSIPAFCGEIHDAAREGDLQKAKKLLEGDPRLVSTRDDFGKVPFHWATQEGHKDVAQLLLGNKAEVNARGNNGVTHCTLLLWGATRKWWNFC
jgi:uncharacterized protein